MFKRRSGIVAVLALAAASVFVLPASSASAGTAMVSNACANSVTVNHSQIEVTTSGDDGLTQVTPGGATSITPSQSAAVPGAIFLAGYNLGLLVEGVNNIPAQTQTRIEATNTSQGTQASSWAGGPGPPGAPNGTVSVTTTIDDPNNVPGTGDETATPASFSVTYAALNWTAGAAPNTIDYRQDSVAALPLTDANNTLRIHAQVGGFLNVFFRCSPGTVTPPDPGTVALIDPAPSFDTTTIGGTPVLTADAGSDQTVASGAAVTLDGSDSIDPEGDATLDYAWTQLSGTAVTLTGADTAMPSFTAPTGPATLEFQLEVCDPPDPLCDTDTVVVTVQGPPPPSTQPPPSVLPSPIAAAPNPLCATLRKKLKAAKKKGDKAKVRKLRRKLRQLGC